MTDDARTFITDFRSPEDLRAFVFVPACEGYFRLTRDEKKNRASVLEIAAIGPQPGDPRRPRTYALLKDHRWTRAWITVDFRYHDSEGVPDVCIPVAYQDERRWYYVHLSTRADRVHTVIMKVDGEHRETIHTRRSGPAFDTPDYHRVRVYVDAAEGVIKAYMNDRDEPVLEGHDPDMKPGLAGFGSFDTLAFFDRFEVIGVSIAAPAGHAYRPDLNATRPKRDQD